MSKESAGLLVYRVRGGELEVLLAHPGGPLWAKKDAGIWSIPKGELKPGEDPLACAQREFEEETGTKPNGPFHALTPIQQKSGKVVRAWAVEADLDLSGFKSNTFKMEWPPHSGRMQEFPEVDKVEYFAVSEAEQKMNPAQATLVRELAEWVRGGKQ